MTISKLKERIYAPEKCELKQSDINHLRRMLAWMRCENKYLFLEHDQHAELSKSLETYGLSKKYEEGVEKAFNRWPKYVHDAHKALSKTIVQIDSQVTDVASREQKELGVNR